MSRKKITLTGFKQQRQRIQELMHVQAAPFENDTPEARNARIERARRDRMYFLHTYLPHYCPSPSPAFHTALFDALNTECTPVAATAPRGGAKSVIASLANPLHKICFNDFHFAIFISDTSELAIDFTNYVKLELEENERIKHDFGDLKGKRKWADGDYVTANGIRVLARGQGQRVRGLRHGPHRPDWVVLDDYESDQQQHNPKILAKKEHWINEVVIPALNPERWFLGYVGTLLSSIAVLSRFMDPEQSPEWIQFNFPAMPTPDTSFWPERFPVNGKRGLLQIKKTIGTRSFNQEYQGIAVDEDTAVFRKKWIRREPLTRELIDSCKFIVTYTDASAKSGETNDFKAIIVLGWDGSRYIVLYAWIRHAPTMLLIDNIYRLHHRFKCVCHGMEEVAFQTLFRDIFMLMAQKHGLHLPMRYRDKLPNKEARVAGMQPYHENGSIIFCEDGPDPDMDAGDMDALIDQHLFFPNPNWNDDGPDATEGAIWLCQQLGAALAGAIGFDLPGNMTGNTRPYSGRHDSESTARLGGLVGAGSRWTM